MQNQLITCGEDSTYKIWNLTNYNPIPYNVFYDTESKIIAADYRSKDSMFACLDNDGNLVIRNLLKDKEFKLMKLGYDNYNFVKFNNFNDYQYFISSKNSFRIFDIRTNYEIENIEEFKNSTEIINDSKNYMLGYLDNTLSVYDTDVLKGGYTLQNSWKDILNVSCISTNSKYYEVPELIAIGNDNGDLYYSKLN